MASEDGTRLLLAVLGGREGTSVAHAPADHWAAAADVAAWHGLQPAMRYALRQSDLLPRVPAAIRNQLDDAHTVAELRAESRRRHLHVLLTSLAVAGVPIIVLKGAYLAEHAWPAAALRPMSDVDLLPPKSQLGAAQAVLATLGYAASPAPRPGPYHVPRVYCPGRLPVELHHTIEPCTPPSTLTLDAMWSRAAPCDVAGVPTLTLSAEDLLLHVAMHMGRSHVLGGWLPSVCDVHAWTERFAASADWDQVVRRARAAGARRFVYAALALARRALGTAVPPDVLLAIGTPADDRIVDHAMGLLASPPVVVAGAAAVTDPRDTTAARARRVARALLVTPTRRLLGLSRGKRSGDASTGPAPEGYVARWPAVARMILNPLSARAVGRQVAQVHALRRWAGTAD